MKNYADTYFEEREHGRAELQTYCSPNKMYHEHDAEGNCHEFENWEPAVKQW